MWATSISKKGKYPKTPFAAVLSEYSITQNVNNTQQLQLDFETGEQVVIYGVGKAVIRDASVEVGGATASFIESLKVLNVESFWDVENGEIIGFKTVPDTIGTKLHLEPLPPDRVGDETQTSTSVFWGMVKKYEKVRRTTGQPASQPVAAASQTGQQTGGVDRNIIKDLIDVLIEPKKISDAWSSLSVAGKKYKTSEVYTALERMKQEGLVVQVGESYKLA